MGFTINKQSNNYVEVRVVRDKMLGETSRGQDLSEKFVWPQERERRELSRLRTNHWSESTWNASCLLILKCALNTYCSNF